MIYFIDKYLDEIDCYFFAAIIDSIELIGGLLEKRFSFLRLHCYYVALF